MLIQSGKNMVGIHVISYGSNQCHTRAEEGSANGLIDALASRKEGEVRCRHGFSCDGKLLNLQIVIDIDTAHDRQLP